MASSPAQPAELEALWLPFTPNRRYKRNPRLISGAQGAYYFTPAGDKLLDAAAGLWCVNAGHNREPIVRAIQRQAAQLDYVSSFNVSHPPAFELARRLTALAPVGLDHVFFTNSGSEAVDTALKIALAYHRARGEGHRQRFIGRQRSYHGVGFGGLSVSGIGNHRKQFGPLLPGISHLCHTHDPSRNAFSRGQPHWGAELADDLERHVQLHDASSIAAVIIEPVAGSTGVLPPPQGYLERLKAICDKHGLLLIFDEVITGFGRIGAAFAAQRFGITPDIITSAKGLTNGAAPMGAVIVRDELHRALMQGSDWSPELFHGYTYSAHPLACAAAAAALDVYEGEGLFDRARELESHFEECAHGLRGLPNVIDIRTIGMLAAIELASDPGAPGRRGYACFEQCFRRGVYVRCSGDILLLSPPLIIDRAQIEQIFATIAEALTEGST